jgi:hypothetical protein
MGREEVYKLCHHDTMELLFVGLGNEGCSVIETVITIFAIGFLGVAVGVGVVCLMVWMALNES